MRAKLQEIQGKGTVKYDARAWLRIALLTKCNKYYKLLLLLSILELRNVVISSSKCTDFQALPYWKTFLFSKQLMWADKSESILTKFIPFAPVIYKEINPSTSKNIMFWSLNQSVMFLESYQQIPDKLNPETKQYETKIIFCRSIQTFKLLMEGLQFLR